MGIMVDRTHGVLPVGEFTLLKIKSQIGVVSFIAVQI